MCAYIYITWGGGGGYAVGVRTGFYTYKIK